MSPLLLGELRSLLDEIESVPDVCCLVCGFGDRPLFFRDIDEERVVGEWLMSTLVGLDRWLLAANMSSGGGAGRLFDLSGESLFVKVGGVNV